MRRAWFPFRGCGLLALDCGFTRGWLRNLVRDINTSALGRLVGWSQLGKVEGHPGNLNGIIFGGVEELEEVLEVAACLILQEPLFPPRRLSVPTIPRLLVLGDVAEPRADDILPGSIYTRLMKQAVDDIGVVPMGFRSARLIMQADVVDVPIHGWQESGAKAAGPGALLARVLDDLVGMGAGFAVMARLVVLVEGIGAPEHSVAVGAGIFLVSLVEFILVSLPVKFSLELGIAPDTRG